MILSWRTLAIFSWGVMSLLNRQKGYEKVCLAIGDSITQGIPYVYPGQTYPEFLETITSNKVINIGIGGITVAEMGMELSSHIEEYGPDFIIFSGGGNDIDYGRGADEIIDDLDVISNTIKESGVRLVLCTITPSSLVKEDEATRTKVNEWIRRKRENWSLADIDKVLLDRSHPSSLASDLDSGDGVHPNAAGMRMIAEVIATALTKIKS